MKAVKNTSAGSSMIVIFQRELIQDMVRCHLFRERRRAERESARRRVSLGLDAGLDEVQGVGGGHLPLDDAVDRVVHAVGHRGRYEKVGLGRRAGDPVRGRRRQGRLERRLLIRDGGGCRT